MFSCSLIIYTLKSTADFILYILLFSWRLKLLFEKLLIRIIVVNVLIIFNWFTLFNKRCWLRITNLFVTNKQTTTQGIKPQIESSQRTRNWYNFVFIGTNLLFNYTLRSWYQSWSLLKFVLIEIRTTLTRKNLFCIALIWARIKWISVKTHRFCPEKFSLGSQRFEISLGNPRDFYGITPRNFLWVLPEKFLWVLPA
jgi:hypothetical protein